MTIKYDGDTPVPPMAMYVESGDGAVPIGDETPLPITLMENPKEPTAGDGKVKYTGRVPVWPVALYHRDAEGNPVQTGEANPLPASGAKPPPGSVSEEELSEDLLERIDSNKLTMISGSDNDADHLADRSAVYLHIGGYGLRNAPRGQLRLDIDHQPRRVKRPPSGRTALH